MELSPAQLNPKNSNFLKTLLHDELTRVQVSCFSFKDCLVTNTNHCTTPNSSQCGVTYQSTISTHKLESPFKLDLGVKKHGQG